MLVRIFQMIATSGNSFRVHLLYYLLQKSNVVFLRSVCCNIVFSLGQTGGHRYHQTLGAVEYRVEFPWSRSRRLTSQAAAEFFPRRRRRI